MNEHSAALDTKDEYVKLLVALRGLEPETCPSSPLFGYLSSGTLDAHMVIRTEAQYDDWQTWETEDDGLPRCCPQAV